MSSRIQNQVNQEISDVQAGFRAGRGTEPEIWYDDVMLIAISADDLPDVVILVQNHFAPYIHH